MHDMEKKAYLKQLEALQKKMAELISKEEAGEMEDEKQEGASEEVGTEYAKEMQDGEKEQMESEGDNMEMSADEIKEYLAKDKKKPMKKSGSLTVAIAMRPKK